MRRAVYATCGTAMLITAVILRTLADGGIELVLLALLGLLLVAGSADHPERRDV